MRIDDVYNSHKQSGLVVFDCRKHSLLAFVHGNTSTVITDSALSETAMKFSSKEYFIRHQAQPTGYFYTDKNSVISIESKTKGTAIFLKDWKKGQHPMIPQKKPNVEVMVLGGYLGVETKDILEFFSPKMIVFDSSCKSYKAKALSKELNRVGIKTHLVLEKGAFVY